MRPAYDDDPVTTREVHIRSVFDVAICDNGSLRIAQRDPDGYMHDVIVSFATAKAEVDFSAAVLEGVQRRLEDDCADRFAGGAA